MVRKKIHLPQQVQRAFLNIARGNVDTFGQLKETLGFLIGHETSDTLIVTDLVFPVQESSATKVDDKGICGQDSSLWMRDFSPAAKNYGDDFRLIAWVHSHVQGAPCGFSSIDVHTQYAYKATCPDWNIYGLVLEIKEDNSCITGWFDLTEEGVRCLSQCTITHVQHGQCSKRSYYQDYKTLINEEDLPLNIVDGRATAPIGFAQPVNDAVIWTLNAQEPLEACYKAHDVCKCCGKYLGSLKSMVGHIGRTKACKLHYGQEYEVMKRTRRCESVKEYNKSNASKIAKKQADYNKKNQEKIRDKQKEYDGRHREQITRKQQEYDALHRVQINKKQQDYNSAHREPIRQKQQDYNKAHREQILIKQQVYNSSNKEQISKKQQKYNKVHQEQINKKQQQYDKNHKEQVIKKQARYNRENRAAITKKQENYNKEHRDQIVSKQAKYNAENRELINEKQKSYNEKNRIDIAGKELKRKEAKRSPMRDFNSEICYGPIFPCCCCYRILFLDGVVEYSSVENIKATIEEPLFSNALKINDQVYIKGKLYLCINCNLLLKKKKMPKISICNGLGLDVIPDDLKLTELEQQLIAKRLLFLKIHLLPRSRMPAMKDRVINVPLEDKDICQTIDSLPRDVNNAGLIGIKLKRMKKLKANHLQAFIRPGAPLQALKTLKELGHPDYQFDLPAHEIISLTSESDESSNSEEDCESEENNANKDFIDTNSIESGSKPFTGHDLYNLSTCLVHDNLESEVLLNEGTAPKTVQYGKDSIELAPGEGKIPTNVTDEKNIDIKAFPCLFPSGKFGCDYERQLNVSKQKYYNQRILNIDNRFRKSPTYLFAAQHIVEREQLEKNINLMVQRGQLQQNSDGSNFMTTSDYYAAFQNVRGSPKYFQTARNELLARVAQLGPFQLFFTLSCAEMRWPEVITTVLQQKGHDVVCIEKEGLEYTVDGQILEDFLNNYGTSKHELFKDDIVTISRIFDHRVKKFVQHILKSSNNNMKIDFYNYRIEFQMRGMAHVHGVIWLEEQGLEKFKKPDRKNYDPDKIPELIDTLITCQLPTDPKLKKIVQEVQIHRHTKTCMKYNNTCRFGYPRFPSKKTIVAKALPSDMDEGEQKLVLAKHKKTLMKVKRILENQECLDDMSIESLLCKAEVSFHDYEEALATSERGYNIILKRNVSECFINNYNKKWIESWNANMDLQFCYDPYAVITYICDYYGKDDSGMTDLLKAALRKVKGEKRHEVLLALKKTYLTHRQIGACEATYRLLPNLHMKDSNVTCTFVSTGFPENRSTFMEKVHFDQSDEENKILNDTSMQKHLGYIQIEGKHGLFKKKDSVHERYAARPSSLDDICLAQFATIYKVSTYKRKNLQLRNGSSILTGHSKIFLSEDSLPIEIHFERKDMSPMQLRGRPAVLRLHESKKKREEHEYFYAEMLLFLPWRDEIVDLQRHDPAKCKKLFKKNFVAIHDRRKIMFPYLDSVEEAQARLEEVSLENIWPSHIGDTLDTEGEHENDEDERVETVISDDFAIFHPGELEATATASSSKDFAQFKVVQVDVPEMVRLTRRLIPEQSIVLSKVVRYCKTLSRSHINCTPPPDPFRIILHGGAGSGKSNVIKIVAKWTEKILRRSGDHPNKPRVLLTAPTGTAASIIGGITLHAAFNFSFGDELKPLSDKKLDELRCALSDVKIIIIDEISMIRSDMLYQLHLRLCEIFQSKKAFGNLSLMLVGDLLQLQPVRGSYIFQSPRCQRYRPFHEVNPLWDEFEVYVLQHNHRQGEEGQWADALNRFRIGLVTDNDLNMLKGKVISEEKAKEKESACHLFYTNKEVDNHNTTMLNKLNTELQIMKAVINVPFGCRSKIYSGRIDQTAFMNTLHVKVGARVMLIHNLSVIDSLTNGAMGKVLDIKLQEGKPYCIVVKFDNDEVGLEQRQKYENISRQYSNENGTPIFRAEVQYQLPSGKSGARQHTATGKLFQFPLRLAWAVTAHKVQGQTFKKNSQIVVHWHKNLGPGMAYVMLGRCESPDDVFISGNFAPNGIKCNEQARKMADELYIRSLPLTQKGNIWKHQRSLKILLNNIRSLKEHSSDVSNCREYENADILCVTETWLKEGEHIDFKSLKHAVYASHPKGRGKGCAIFCRKNFTNKLLAIQDYFQMVQIVVESLQIVLVYRNKEQSMSGLVKFLEENINFTQPTLLIGDFNVHADNQSVLAQAAKGWHLQQKIKEPTHDEGNVLDHVYISKELSSSCYESLIPVTFSDHDLLKIEIVL